MLLVFVAFLSVVMPIALPWPPETTDSVGQTGMVEQDVGRVRR